MDPAALAFRFWLAGGVVGSAGVVEAPAEGGFGVTGSLGFAFGKDPSRGVGLLIQERESWQFPPERHVTSIGVLGRYPADDGLWGGLGFAHHHELPWSLYKEEPLEAILAIHPNITHRTGFEVAVGWDFAPAAPDSPVARRFRPSLQLSVITQPATEGPLFYAMLMLTMRVGIL